MATFGQMTDEVARKLAGFTLRQDRQTHTTQAVTTSATTIHLGSANNISTGIIQIDDELIYVDSYDRNANTVSVPPYGRGYNGTTAASHQVGAKVTVSPTFPNVDIKGAINDTIIATGDLLYATATTSFAYSPAVSTYALPNAVDKVLSVSYQTTGPTKEWLPIRGWRHDAMANVAEWGSRNTISLYSGVEPGRTVQVWYKCEPSTLDSNSDDFSIVSGLQQSAKDVMILGAAYRLASFVDPGRLTYSSAEADAQSQVAGRTYGAGTNAAKYLLALYEKRLQEEVAKLNDRNPIRIHFTR